MGSDSTGNIQWSYTKYFTGSSSGPNKTFATYRRQEGFKTRDCPNSFKPVASNVKQRPKLVVKENMLLFTLTFHFPKLFLTSIVMSRLIQIKTRRFFWIKRLYGCLKPSVMLSGILQ